MQTHTHPLNLSKASHSFRGKTSRRLFAYWAILSMLLTPVVANPAYAAIADAPLYLTSPVEPNIMFVLDDSGSMQWDVMPDHSLVYFTFPRPDLLYGTSYSAGYDSLTSTSGYYNGVARFDPADRYARYFRTAQFNPLYYNPATRYEPWKNADGSSMSNSVATAALHNPMTAGEGSRNLTVDNTDTAVWIDNDGDKNSTSLTYYPATYFSYSGPLPLTGPTHANNIQANFTRVEIKPATAFPPKAATRTDCAAATCTYSEEMQNFANWYTYYRSRILSSRAGIGKAFAQQGTNMRVGFGAINKGSATIDGAATRTIVRGVRSFTGTDRTNFFGSLYTHAMPTSGTPLRRALDDVGQYYSRSADAGPWGNAPGTSDATAHLECRQSYTVLMTDGYWSGGSSYQASTSGARENVDGTGGPTITGSGTSSYTYSAVSPFTDGYDNTLADVAMYYWKRDLRTTLGNEVPTSDLDPAFWQHMVTFGVGLGVTGSVSPDDAFGAIDSDPLITINWSDPTSSNAAKLDDLLHASVNGRGGFFSASDPNTFATELSGVLDTITDRTSSSSAVASNSTRQSSSTHLYQALFKSGDWSGQLKAFPLLADGSIGPEAWDAADGIPAHGSRNIKTWNGSAGTDFLGALGSLSAAQVDYLRGDDSLEISNSTGPSDTLHVFRNRSGKLGDIINSDPHYVKNENFGYNTLPGAEGISYSAFVLGKNDRPAMIYAGANDGMLHGFDASFIWQDSDSAVDSDGDGDFTNDHDVYVQSPNAGNEVFAFVPNALWPNLPLLTNPAYTHKYFVDGSPTAWDAYWGTSWKTVLVGSLGAGGKAVYALDVSNPDAFGNSNVLWEFTHADMGYVMGSVTVARFKDGKYWTVFGNGYASSSGQAVLFMVRVDDPSIVKTIPVGAAGIGNGLSTPTLVDSDGDHIVDRIYAGDLKGNVWRFYVDHTNDGQWESEYTSGSTPAPLFTAKDGSGIPQPITLAPEVGLAPSGASGLMVYFGTGKYFETGDEITTSVQSMYGIVDSGSKFTGTNHRTQLQQQSIIYESTVGGNDVRVMSDNTVSYPSEKGWVIDLLTPPSTATGERVITSPVLFGGKLLFQTIVPSPSSCDYGGTSWLMQVNPATGGALLAASFDINGDNLFNTNDQIDIGGGVMANASGVDVGVGISGGFGSPISAGGTAFVPLSGTGGNGAGGGDGGGGGGGGGAGPKAPKISTGILKSRASWRQIQ
ncbi:MAG: pilus assembly protein [Thiobacillus sp.]